MFITFVRDHKKISMFFILFTVVAFAITPLLRIREIYSAEKPLFAQVGEHQVDPNAYRRIYENSVLRAHYQEKLPYVQAVYVAHRRAWHYFSEKLSLENPFAKMGITIPKNERKALILDDKNLEEEFTDPQTGTKPSQKKILQELAARAKSKSGAQRFQEREEFASYFKMMEKFENIVLQGYQDTTSDLNFLTPLQEKKVTAHIIFIPYTAILTEKFSQKEKEAYLAQHQKEYQWEDQKEVAYIMIPIDPSDRDWDALEEREKATKAKFAKEKKDPIAFATRYSDDKEKVKVEYAENKIPKNIKNTLTANGKKPLAPSSKVVVQEHEKAQAKVLYRLVKVSRNLRMQKVYTFARIVHDIKVQDDTREDIERDASQFIHDLKKNKVTTFKDFEKIADKQGYKAEKSNFKEKEAQVVGLPDSYRRTQIARWAYREKKTLKVSKPKLIGGGTHYFVALILKHHKKGPQKLEDIQDKIKEAVITENRKKELLKTLTPLLDQKELYKKVKNHYPNHTKLFKDKVITLETATLDKDNAIGEAHLAIGKALTLTRGEKIILPTAKGIVIIACKKNETLSPSKEKKKEDKEKEEQEKLQKFFHNLKRAYLYLLEEQGYLLDYRYKYLD